MYDDRLISIFFDLIKIEGLSGSEKKVAEYILHFLSSLNLKPYSDNSAHITKSDTGNIICHIGSESEFVLLSHMDTARSTKGVRPAIKDDRIISDGTTVLGVDNRAGIAAILFAIERAVKNGISTKDFTVAFTTQEETTLNGSQTVELNGKIKAGFVFDSRMRPGYYVSESVGSKGFSVSVIGKAAHSGLAPEKGIDSIKVACEAVAPVKLGRIDEFTTANIGLINGGTATNVVPELTVVHGEVRSTKPEMIDLKIDEIKKSFIAAAQKYNAQIEFSEKWNFKPYRVDSKGNAHSMLLESFRKTGLEPTPEISWGGSDANSLNARGIETINIGIGAENPHSNDEFILLEDLQNASRIAYNLITKN